VFCADTLAASNSIRPNAVTFVVSVFVVMCGPLVCRT
jgi:hypothetical protein